MLHPMALLACALILLPPATISTPVPAYSHFRPGIPNPPSIPPPDLWTSPDATSTGGSSIARIPSPIVSDTHSTSSSTQAGTAIEITPIGNVSARPFRHRNIVNNNNNGPTNPNQNVTNNNNNGPSTPSQNVTNNNNNGPGTPTQSDPTSGSMTTTNVATQPFTQLPNPSQFLGGTLGGRIIGAVIGSILGLVIVIAIAVLLFRRRQRRRRDTMPRPLLPEDQISARRRGPTGSQTVARDRNVESRVIGADNPLSMGMAIPVDDDEKISLESGSRPLNRAQAENGINPVQQLFQDREFENQLLQFIQSLRMDRIPRALRSSSRTSGVPSSESLSQPPAYDSDGV